MAATSLVTSSSPLPTKSLTVRNLSQQLLPFRTQSRITRRAKKQGSFTVQAAKLPAGVELPKVQPKVEPPFLGFSKTAEIWNSRACMIGLIGTFIVELILNKGILQVIGVDIGKGLDLPL
ncbi:putative OHP [Tripterygium wilfordii]|uniref:Putative OHP n=1 Tax=Tripterygium wilfordii TaxID=458696 RepID=A0A7J7DX13_TRIWF|nr:light-harvesting complex-like protein OHP1, chloroplastic [Tripterygium wilfordii]KAF5750918.1 putative OHP [Tripterygium wilfordii]